MTDSEIDDALARVGRSIRAEADLENSQRALSAVHARADGLAEGATRPESHLRAYGLLFVAAIVVLVVLGGVAWLRPSTDSVVLTTPSTMATPPSTPALTRPVTIPAIPTTPPSSVAQPTTVPSDTLPPRATMDTVRVSDVVSDGGPRPVEELLHSAEVELGYEDCGGCDPVTPWGPVAINDGRVIVADELNRRWVVGSQGGSTESVPYPEGFRAISAPVLGPDGLLYIVNGNYDLSDGDLNNGDALLTVFELTDLTTPVREIAIARRSSSQLWFNGSRVFVDGRAVLDSVSPPAPDLPVVEWRTDGPTRIVVTWDGVSRTWEFDPGVGVGASTSAGGALADGSVLVVDVATQATIRLFPDGTAVRFHLPGAPGYNGTRQISATDVVQFGTSTGGGVSVVRAYLPPASPTRVVEPTAPAFEATGDAASICQTAEIAVSTTGYEFGAIVLADTQSVVDGTEWRWLVCGGDAVSGWGVVILVSDDSTTWRLTSLELGYFTHSGDRAFVAVDGPQATVWWQSWVGERLVEATTADLGATWLVSDSRSADLDVDSWTDG